jgi:hypothetical protein
VSLAFVYALWTFDANKGSNKNRTTLSDDCSAADNGNTGCNVESSSSGSYGAAFNAEKGGFYVMSRSEAAIKVWFWERNDFSAPLPIRYGPTVSQMLIPDSSWGEPLANFPMVSGSCGYDQYFDAHNIVFDLTFCVRTLFPSSVVYFVRA